MNDPTPEEMTTLARTMDWLMAREMVARAEAWDEGFKQGGPMHDEHYDDPDAHTRNPYRDTKPTEYEETP